jgi:hypothetical protein
MVNSQLKGKAATLEVCKILNKYFDGKFERRGYGQKGADIHCPDGFPYAPEVKHHKSVKAIHLLVGKNKTLEKWWDQTSVQARNAGKDPLLIIKVERFWIATSDHPLCYRWEPLEEWCGLRTNYKARK